MDSGTVGSCALSATARKKKPPLAARGHDKCCGLLAAASRHAATRALLGIDRNQESVPIRVGELVSLSIGTVLEGAVHLETAIILCAEIFYVPQHDAFAIRARLAL